MKIKPECLPITVLHYTLFKDASEGPLQRKDLSPASSPVSLVRRADLETESSFTVRVTGSVKSPASRGTPLATFAEVGRGPCLLKGERQTDIVRLPFTSSIATFAVRPQSLVGASLASMRTPGEETMARLRR